jgi:hypothetical protein
VVRLPPEVDRSQGGSAGRGPAAARSGLIVFTPSRESVRQFFRDTWRKHRAGDVLAPIEALALDWIIAHPEYHAELEVDAGSGTDYRIEDGRTNPFLHLSMHLAIAEQLSVDQPPGIRAAHARLLARCDDAHAAAHEVMECLGEIVWSAQRSGHALPPEEMSERYLDCLRRRAGAG